MKRRDKIFERLALREKLFINKQMRNLGDLHGELQKIQDMQEKLSVMATDTMPRNEEQTVFTLRSSAELNYQIRDQLETANNRSEHLTEEMKSMRQKIALSDRRRERSLGKATQIRRANQEQRDARREDDDASRRKSCPR